jgi:mono/diheme cytochrome c family protein
MRSRLFVFLIISIITLLTFSFKSYHLNDDPWLAPSFADTIISPIPFSPQVINEGEKLYNVFCVSCHGQDGFGNGQPGRFNIEPANFHDKKFVSQTDGAIFWKLTHGKGIMPAYNHALSEEKRWQIIAYIRQFVKYSANVQSKSVPIKNYIIDSEFRSNYFPIPKKISNANLSDVIYDPDGVGSAVSADVAADFCHANIKFSPAFLAAPMLANTLTDTHFKQRDRMGRLMVFLGHYQARDLTGIAVSERTALWVERSGATEVFGEHEVYIVRADEHTRWQQTQCGQPVQITDLLRYRLTPGDHYQLLLHQSNVSPIRLSLDGSKSSIYSPANPY